MIGALVFFSNKLLAFATLLQGLELLQIEQRWRQLKLSDGGNTFQRNFLPIVYVQLAVSVLLLLWFSKVALLGLFLCSLAISTRWRGAFNGGSDAMTLILTGGLTVIAIAGVQSPVGIGCAYFLGLQTVFSYFKAGWVKIRHPGWRSGETLQEILNTPQLGAPSRARHWSHKINTMKILSWALLTFELLFPFTLLFKTTLLIAMILAICFHILNIWLFGLNRFLWIWVASYPLLWILALQLQSLVF